MVITPEELREMVERFKFTLEPNYDPSVKGPPFTKEERPIVCCNLCSRMVVGMLPSEWEDTVFDLLLQEILRGNWGQWRSQTEAIVTGLRAVGVKCKREEMADQLFYEWLTLRGTGYSCKVDVAPET